MKTAKAVSKTNIAQPKPAPLPAEQIQAATAAVAGLHRRMGFLLPLTPAERKEHRSARIGPKSLRLVDNRLVAARQHRELLPPSFDLQKFEQDAGLAAALQDCLEAIDAMRGEVNDTLLAVGNRAVVAGATPYAHIQVGSTTAQRLKRTVERLAARSSRTGTTPVAAIAPGASGTPAEPAEPPKTGTGATPETPVNKAAQCRGPSAPPLPTAPSVWMPGAEGEEESWRGSGRRIAPRFIHKLRLGQKELRESKRWLRLLQRWSIIEPSKINRLERNRTAHPDLRQEHPDRYSRKNENSESSTSDFNFDVGR